MRRGLMAWDSDEIPVWILKDRVERLRASMEAANQDAMILYTNFIRSAAVSHLVGFSPYWADGILLVPREGEPVFATTLSKRVGTWIQSVKPVGELVNTPTPGKVLGERLAKSARRVAILELDAFPGGLYGELAAALPGVEFVDGSESFAELRWFCDPVERQLLVRADEIGREALKAAPSEATDIGASLAAVEVHARLNGAEEVYVAIAPDLDADRRFLRLSGARLLGRRYAIRATVAYKGSWIRRTRTYSQDGNDRLAIERADAWFQVLADSVRPDPPVLSHLLFDGGGLPNAEIIDILVEAPVGTRPLVAVESSTNWRDNTYRRIPAVVVSMGLTIDGVPWHGARLAGTSA